LPFASCKELLIDLFVETRGLVVYSAMGKHIGDVFVVEEVIDAETDLRLVEHLAPVWRVKFRNRLTLLYGATCT
jgi:hypothetical protein